LATGTDYLKITAKGADSGQTINVTEISDSAGDICGNYMIVHKSKPSISTPSLPSTTLVAGTKTLYRWTVTADDEGAIGWKKVIFETSGSITVSDTGYTIGMGTGTASALNHAVYAGTSTYDGTKLITNLKVYNVATNEEVTASTTPYVYNDADNGGAKIIFNANSEEVIAAGQTKTYELKGNISQSGASGDSISTYINTVATATSTGTLLTQLGGAGVEATSTDTATFVWTDRSGAGSSHSTWSSSDWTNEYKVTGLPTNSLSLSR
jgi:hypothetical protein